MGDDLSKIATVIQDAALFFSLAGATLEIGGAVIGGPEGLKVGYATQLIVTNPVETYLSWSSTGMTVISDMLLGNTNVTFSSDSSSVDVVIGESTATSVTGSILGTIVPEGIIDSIIDGYLSSYNHGEAPGIYSIVNLLLK
jgi:hypothetical protein